MRDSKECASRKANPSNLSRRTRRRLAHQSNQNNQAEGGINYLTSRSTRGNSLSVLRSRHVSSEVNTRRHLSSNGTHRHGERSENIPQGSDRGNLEEVLSLRCGGSSSYQTRNQPPSDYELSEKANSLYDQIREIKKRISEVTSELTPTHYPMATRDILTAVSLGQYEAAQYLSSQTNIPTDDTSHSTCSCCNGVLSYLAHLISTNPSFERPRWSELRSILKERNPVEHTPNSPDVKRALNEFVSVSADLTVSTVPIAEIQEMEKRLQAADAEVAYTNEQIRSLQKLLDDIHSDSSWRQRSVSENLSSSSMKTSSIVRWLDLATSNPISESESELKRQTDNSSRHDSDQGQVDLISKISTLIAVKEAELANFRRGAVKWASKHTLISNKQAEIEELRAVLSNEMAQSPDVSEVDTITESTKLKDSNVEDLISQIESLRNDIIVFTQSVDPQVIPNLEALSNALTNAFDHLRPLEVKEPAAKIAAQMEYLHQQQIEGVVITTENNKLQKVVDEIIAAYLPSTPSPCHIILKEVFDSLNNSLSDKNVQIEELKQSVKELKRETEYNREAVQILCESRLSMLEQVEELTGGEGCKDGFADFVSKLRANKSLDEHLRGLSECSDVLGERLRDWVSRRQDTNEALMKQKDEEIARLLARLAEEQALIMSHSDESRILREQMEQLKETVPSKSKKFKSKSGKSGKVQQQQEIESEVAPLLESVEEPIQLTPAIPLNREPSIESDDFEPFTSAVGGKEVMDSTSDLRSKLSEQAALINHLEARLCAQNEELQSKLAEANEKNNQFNTIQSSYETDIQRLKSVLRQKTSDVSDLSAKLNSSELTIATLNERIAELKIEVSTVRVELLTIQAEFAEKNLEVERIQGLMHDKNQEMNDLRDVLTCQEAQMHNLRFVLNNKDADLTQKNKQIQTLSENLSSRTHEAEMLRHDFDYMNSLFGRLWKSTLLVDDSSGYSGPSPPIRNEPMHVLKTSSAVDQFLSLLLSKEPGTEVGDLQACIRVYKSFKDAESTHCCHAEEQSSLSVVRDDPALPWNPCCVTAVSAISALLEDGKTFNVIRDLAYSESCRVRLANLLNNAEAQVSDLSGMMESLKLEVEQNHIQLAERTRQLILLGIDPDDPSFGKAESETSNSVIIPERAIDVKQSAVEDSALKQCTEDLQIQPHRAQQNITSPEKRCEDAEAIRKLAQVDEQVSFRTSEDVSLPAQSIQALADLLSTEPNVKLIAEKIEFLQEELLDNLAEKGRLQQQLHKVRDQLEKLSTGLENQNATKLSEIEERLNSLLLEKSSLEEQLNEQREKMKRMETDNFRLEAEGSQLLSKLSKIEAALKLKDSEIESLNQKLRLLEVDNEQKSFECTSLQANLEHLTQQLNDAKSAAVSFDSAIEPKLVEPVKAEPLLKSMLQKETPTIIDAYHEFTVESGAIVDDLMNRLSALQEQVSSVRGDEPRSWLCLLEQTGSGVSSLLKNLIDLKQRVAVLEAERNESQKELDIMLNSKETLVARLTSIEYEKAVLEDKLHEAQTRTSELGKLQKQLDTLTVALSDKSSECTILLERVNQLSQDMNVAGSFLSDSRQQTATEAFRTESMHSASDVVDTSDDKDLIVSHLTALAEQLKPGSISKPTPWSDLIDKIESDISSLLRDTASLQQRLIALESEKEDLQMTYDQMSEARIEEALVAQRRAEGTTRKKDEELKALVERLQQSITESSASAGEVLELRQRIRILENEIDLLNQKIKEATELNAIEPTRNELMNASALSNNNKILDQATERGELKLKSEKQKSQLEASLEVGGDAEVALKVILKEKERKIEALEDAIRAKDSDIMAAELRIQQGNYALQEEITLKTAECNSLIDKVNSLTQKLGDMESNHPIVEPTLKESVSSAPMITAEPLIKSQKKPRVMDALHEYADDSRSLNGVNEDLLIARLCSLTGQISAGSDLPSAEQKSWLDLMDIADSGVAGLLRAQVDLKQHVRVMESKLGELREELEMKETSVQILEDEQLRRDASLYNLEGNMEEILTRLLSQVNILMKTLNSGESRVAELSSMLENSRIKESELRTEHDGISDRESHLRSELDKLAVENASLLSKCDQMTKTLSDAEMFAEKLEAMKQDMQVIEEEKALKALECTTLNREIAALNEKISAAEAREAVLISLSPTTEAATNLQQEILELNQENVAKTTQIALLESEMNALNAELEKILDNYDSKAVECEHLSAKVVYLTHQLDASRDQTLVMKDIKPVSIIPVAAEQQLLSAPREIIEIRDDSEWQKLNEEQATHIVQIEDEKRQLKGTLDARETEIKSLKDQIAYLTDTESTNLLLNAEIKALKAKLSESVELEDMRKRLVDLETKNNHRSNEILLLKQELTDRDSGLQNLEVLIIDLNQRLHSQTAAIDSTLSISESRKADLLLTLERLRSDLADKAKKENRLISEFDQKHSKLSKALEEKVSNQKSLEESVKELQEKLEQSSLQKSDEMAPEFAELLQKIKDQEEVIAKKNKDLEDQIARTAELEEVKSKLNESLLLKEGELVLLGKRLQKIEGEEKVDSLQLQINELTETLKARESEIGTLTNQSNAVEVEEPVLIRPVETAPLLTSASSGSSNVAYEKSVNEGVLTARLLNLIEQVSDSADVHTQLHHSWTDMIDQVEAEICHLLKDQADLKVRLGIAESEKKVMTEVLEDGKTQLQELSEQISEKQTELLRRDEKLNQMEKEIEEISSRLTTTEDSTTITAMLEDYKQRELEMRNDLDKLRARESKLLFELEDQFIKENTLAARLAEKEAEIQSLKTTASKLDTGEALKNELEILRQEIEQKSRTIADLTSQLETYEARESVLLSMVPAEISQLNDSTEFPHVGFEKALELKQSELDVLQSQFTETKQMLEEILASKENYQNALIQLENDLEAKENDLNQLIATMKSQTLELESLEHANRQKSDEIGRLMQQLVQINTQPFINPTLIKPVTTEPVLTSASPEHSSPVDDNLLVARISSLLRRISDPTDSQSEVRRTWPDLMDQADSDVSRLMRSLDDLKMKIRTLESDLDKKDALVETLYRELSVRDDSLHGVEASLIDLSSRLNQNLDGLTDTVRTGDDKFSELLSAIEDLCTKKDQLEGLLVKLESDRKEHKDKLKTTAIQAEIEPLSEQSGALEEQLRFLQAEIAKRDESLKSMESKLQQAILEYSKESDSVLVETEKLHHQLQFLQEMKDQKSAECAALQGQVENLTEELEVAKARQVVLLSLSETLPEPMDSSATKDSSVTLEIQKKNEEQSSLISSLEDALKLKTDEESALRKKLQNLEETVVQKEDECNHLIAEVSNLTQQLSEAQVGTPVMETMEPDLIVPVSTEVPLSTSPMDSSGKVEGTELFELLRKNEEQGIRIVEIEREKRQLEESLNSKDLEINSLKDHLSHLSDFESVNLQLNAEIATLKDALGDSAKLKEMKMCLKNKDENIQRLTNKVCEIQKDLAERDATLQNLEVNMAQLHSKLSSQLRGLESKLNSRETVLSMEAESENQVVKKLSKALESKEEDVRSLREEKELLEARLQQLPDLPNLEALQQRIHSLEDENARKAVECKSLLNEVDVLTVELNAAKAREAVLLSTFEPNVCDSLKDESDFYLMTPSTSEVNEVLTDELLQEVHTTKLKNEELLSRITEIESLLKSKEEELAKATEKTGSSTKDMEEIHQKFKGLEKENELKTAELMGVSEGLQASKTRESLTSDEATIQASESQLKSNIMELKQENEALMARLVELESSLKHKDEEISALGAETSKISFEFEVECQGLREKLDVLQNKMLQKVAECNSLTQELEATRKSDESAVSSADIDELKKANQAKTILISNLEFNLKMEEAELESLKDRLNQALGERDEIREKLSLTDDRQLRNAFEAEILKSDLKEARDALTKRDRDLQNLESSLTDLANRLLTQLNDLEGTVNSGEPRIFELLSSIEEFEAKEGQLKQELNALREKSPKTPDNSQREVQELQEQLDNLQNTFDQKVADYNSLQQEFDTIKARESVLMSLTPDEAAIQAGEIALKAKIAKLEALLKVKEGEVVSSQASNVELHHKLKELRDLNDKKTTDFERMKEDLEALKTSKVSAMEPNIAEPVKQELLASALPTVTPEMKSLSEENEALLARVANLETLLKSKGDELKTLRNETEKLSRDAETKEFDLRNQLKALQVAIGEKEVQCYNLNQELQEAKARESVLVSLTPEEGTAESVQAQLQSQIADLKAILHTKVEELKIIEEKTLKLSKNANDSASEAEELRQKLREMEEAYTQKSTEYGLLIDELNSAKIKGTELQSATPVIELTLVEPVKSELLTSAPPLPESIDETESLRLERDVLTSRIATLEANLKDKEDEIKILSDEIQHQLERKTADIVALNKEIEMFKARESVILSKAPDKEAIQASEAEVKCKIAELEAALQSKNAGIKSLEEEISKMSQNANMSASEAEGLRRKLKDTEEAYGQKAEEYERLLKELVAAKNTVPVIEPAIDHPVKSRLLSASVPPSEDQTMISEVHDSLRLENAALSSRVTDLQSEIVVLHEEVSKISYGSEAEIQSLRRKLESLQAELEATRMSSAVVSNEEIEALKVELNEAKEVLGRKVSDCPTLVTETQRLEEEVSAVNSHEKDLQNLESSMTSLSARFLIQLKDLALTIDSGESRVSDLLLMIKELRLKEQQLRNESNNKGREVETLCKRVSETHISKNAEVLALREQMNTLLGALDQKVAECTSLTHSRETVKARESLLTSLTPDEAVIQLGETELKSQAAALQARLSETEIKATEEDMQDKSLSLSQSVEASTAETELLRQKLKEMEDVNAQKIAECERLIKELKIVKSKEPVMFAVEPTVVERMKSELLTSASQTETANQFLTSRTVELEAIMQDKDGEMVGIREEIEQNLVATDLRQQLARLQEEFDRQEVECNSLKQELESMKATVSSDELEALRKMLEEKDLKLQELDEVNNSRSAECTSLRNDVKRLKGEVDVAQGHEKNLSDIESKMTDLSTHLLLQLNILMETIDSGEIRVRDLMSLVENLKSRESELQRELDEKRKKLTQVYAELADVEDLKKKLNEKELNIEEKEEELTKLRKESSKNLEMEIQELRQQLEILSSAVQKKSAEVTLLNEKLQAAEARESLLMSLTPDEAAIQASEIELKSKMADLEANLRSKEAEVKALEDRKQEEILKLSQNADISAEMEELRRKLLEMEETYTQKSAECESLIEELNSAKIRGTKLQSMTPVFEPILVEPVKSELLASAPPLAESVDKVESLRKENDALISRNANLEASLKDRENEIKTLGDEMRTIQHQLEQKTADFDVLNNEIETFKARESVLMSLTPDESAIHVGELELKSKIDDLEGSLRTKEEVIRNLENEASKLSNCSAELQQKLQELEDLHSKKVAECRDLQEPLKAIEPLHTIEPVKTDIFESVPFSVEQKETSELSVEQQISRIAQLESALTSKEDEIMALKQRLSDEISKNSQFAESEEVIKSLNDSSNVNNSEFSAFKESPQENPEVKYLRKCFLSAEYDSYKNCEDMKRLVSELVYYEKQLQTREKDVNDFEARLIELSSRLFSNTNDLSAIVDSGESRISNLMSIVDELTAKESDLRDEITERKALVNRLRGQLDEELAKSRQLANDNAKLKAAKEELNRRCNMMADEMKCHSDEQKTLEDALKAREGKQKSLEVTLKAKNNEMEQLKQCLWGLEDAKSRLVEQIESLNQELNEAKARDQASTIIEPSIVQATSAEPLLTAYPTDHQADRDAQLARLSELREVNKKLEESLEAKEKSCKTLQDALKVKENELKDMDNLLKCKESDLTSLEESLQQMSFDMDSLNQHIQELKQENSSKSAELKAALQEKEILVQKLEVVQATSIPGIQPVTESQHKDFCPRNLSSFYTNIVEKVLLLSHFVQETLDIVITSTSVSFLGFPILGCSISHLNAQLSSILSEIRFTTQSRDLSTSAEEVLSGSRKGRLSPFISISSKSNSPIHESIDSSGIAKGLLCVGACIQNQLESLLHQAFGSTSNEAEVKSVMSSWSGFFEKLQNLCNSTPMQLQEIPVTEMSCLCHLTPNETNRQLMSEIVLQQSKLSPSTQSLQGDYSSSPIVLNKYYSQSEPDLDLSSDQNVRKRQVIHSLDRFSTVLLLYTDRGRKPGMYPLASFSNQLSKLRLGLIDETRLSPLVEQKLTTSFEVPSTELYLRRLLNIRDTEVLYLLNNLPGGSSLINRLSTANVLPSGDCINAQLRLMSNWDMVQPIDPSCIPLYRVKLPEPGELPQICGNGHSEVPILEAESSSTPILEGIQSSLHLNPDTVAEVKILLRKSWHVLKEMVQTFKRSNRSKPLDTQADELLATSLKLSRLLNGEPGHESKEFEVEVANISGGDFKKIPESPGLSFKFSKAPIQELIWAIDNLEDMEELRSLAHLLTQQYNAIGTTLEQQLNLNRDLRDRLREANNHLARIYLGISQGSHRLAVMTERLRVEAEKHEELSSACEEITSPNQEPETAKTDNGHTDRSQEPQTIEEEPQASNSRKSERQKSSTLLRHLRHAMKPKTKK